MNSRRGLQREAFVREQLRLHWGVVQKIHERDSIKALITGVPLSTSRGDLMFAVDAQQFLIKFNLLQDADLMDAFLLQCDEDSEGGKNKKL